MNSPPVSVESRSELAEACRIRQQVFVREQQIRAESDDDGLDSEAIHILILSGQTPVATGRLLVRGPEAITARIAVLPEHRGRGIGRMVVASLEKIAGERGANRVVLHPHSYLEGFYKGMGYATIAGREVVGTHELITMEKRLRGGQ